MAVKKQYYFIYNGRRYESGTVLKFRPWRSSNLEQQVEEVIFEWYLPESDKYVLKYHSTYNVNGMTGVGMDGAEFRKHFIAPTNKVNESVAKSHKMRMENSKITWEKEIAIEGMLFAWVCYLVLMGISFVFNGRVFYWALISFCFFIYRTGKLKEHGYSNSLENKGCGSVVLTVVIVIAIILMLL